MNTMYQLHFEELLAEFDQYVLEHPDFAQRIPHSLHKGLHTDACVRNMKAIREMGLEAWLTSGKRHTYWGEVVDRISN